MAGPMPACTSLPTWLATPTSLLHPPPAMPPLCLSPAAKAKPSKPPGCHSYQLLYMHDIQAH
jgi:hypothetical protein